MEVLMKQLLNSDNFWYVVGIIIGATISLYFAELILKSLE